MAHIANRSRFRVTVKNKPELTKYFSFSKLAEVEAYMKDLRSQDFKPKAVQLDESWLVRIRDRGHKPLEATFSSEAAASQFVDKVTEERKRGLFLDYTAALKVTVADIVVRYLLEETSRKKSGAILAYTLEGWLEDSGPRGIELLNQYRDELRARGRPVREPKFKMRKPSTELAWMHKRLAEVTTVDIEAFLNDRLEVVAKATVDREIDRLKAIFKVVTKVWDYNLAKNPMDGVRRPDFFNERDRRISPDEEARLMEALAQLDLERAVKPMLHSLTEVALPHSQFSSNSARKKVLVQARKDLRTQAEEEAYVEPYLQAFYLFQVMTGARRGETVNLTWDRIDFKAKTAFLPETKNGRARKLSLRQDLIEILAELPRDTPRIFDVGLDYIVGAWNKACGMAGIEDLRIHDCRHEALSRVAETGKFSIPELQVFSGHRDVRMLMRYAHLCASKLASKLDECFKDEAKVRVHCGRKFLNKEATVKVRDLVEAAHDRDEHIATPAAFEAPVEQAAQPPRSRAAGGLASSVERHPLSAADASLTRRPPTQWNGINREARPDSTTASPTPCSTARIFAS